MEPLVPWEGGFYLPPDAARPIFQGDVFADVPLVKVRRGNAFAEDPRPTIERRHVAILGFPCDLYPPRRVELSRVQSIGLVRQLTEAMSADLDSSYEVCPLPDLFGDGQMWCVDFRLISNVDRFYLTKANRLVSLSEAGWAFFKFRKILCDTRIKVSMDELRRLGRVQWEEVRLWEHWIRTDRAEAEFPAWMDEPNLAFAGSSPRTALEAGIELELLAAAIS